MKKTKKVYIVDTPKKYMAEGGEGFEEIQAERGELFMLPDFQLVDSKAEEKHKDMESHEITDELVKGSFVFSDSKKNLLKLKDIEDLEISKGISYYQEGDTSKREDMYLSDYLPKSKKEITYAEAAKSIKRKIRLEDLDNETNDPYTRMTNEMNKDTRKSVLAKLIELQELNKPKPKMYEFGGRIMEDGGIAGLLESFKSALSGYDIENEDSYKKGIADYTSLNNKLGLLNAASLVGNTLFTGAQKTLVEPAYKSSSLADSMFRSIPPAALKESYESRRGVLGSLANQYLSAGMDPSKVSSYLAPLSEKILDTEGDQAFKALEYQTQMDNAKATFRSKILNENIEEGASAQRATDDNSNKAISIVGKGVDSFIDNLGKGAVDYTTNLRKALGEYNNNKLSLMKTRLNLDTSLVDYKQRQSELDFKKKQFEESLKSSLNSSKKVDGTSSTAGIGSNTIGSTAAGSNSPVGTTSAVSPDSSSNSSSLGENGHILQYRDMSDGLFQLYKKANSTGMEDDYQAFLTEVRKYVPEEKYKEIEKDLHSGKIAFSPSTIGVGPAVGALYDANGELLIPLDYFKRDKIEETQSIPRLPIKGVYNDKSTINNTAG